MTKPTKETAVNKELVKPEASMPPAVAAPNLGFGDEEILSSDIIIPKLLLMQGLSELVSERKANQGDIVRQTTAEVLGGPGKLLEFIPLTFFNQWINYETVGGKPTYRGVEPMTAKNDKLLWDYEKNGAKWRRVKSINLYALLSVDVAKEMLAKKAAVETNGYISPENTLMPVLISFQSMSYDAGKAVVTHFAKARKQNTRAYVATMNLSCKLEKNDKGSFYTFLAQSGVATSPEVQVLCEEWYASLKTRQYKTDDSDLIKENESTARVNPFAEAAAEALY
jgi:hypothetical protein